MPFIESIASQEASLQSGIDYIICISVGEDHRCAGAVVLPEAAAAVPGGILCETRREGQGTIAGAHGHQDFSQD